jgi:hypothetical protein
MFDGTPIPTPPWDALLPALVAMTMGVAALAALRMVHAGEWELTWSGLINPRAMWLGRHVEGGRTIGVALSHIVGLCGWALLGWASGMRGWEGPAMSDLPQELHLPGTSPMEHALWGVLLGSLTLPLRWLARRAAGWMSEAPEATWQHGETDRLLRNAWTVIAAGLVLLTAVQSRVLADVEWGQRLVLGAYVIFLGGRSFRLLQLMRVNSLSIGWGFAYLCTLELIPSWVLISVLLGGGGGH